MAIIGTFTKQPGEILPFKISYVDVLAGRTATSITPVMTLPTGLTSPAEVLSGSVYQGFVAGGTHGVDYIVTVVTDILIAGNVTRVEDEVRVKVRSTPTPP